MAEGTTLDDLREAGEYDDETSDSEVFFEEFEAALTEMKRATLALRSRRDPESAAEYMNEAIRLVTQLQFAVLSFVSDVENEDGDAEDGGDDDEEDDREDGGDDSDDSDDSDAEETESGQSPPGSNRGTNE